MVVPLRELTPAHLLTEHRPGRFACHDLLRAYAVELAATSGTDGALARVLDHYTRTANAATALIDPPREPVEPPPPVPGAQPEPLADITAAQNWYATEYPVLTATTEAAWTQGFLAHARHLAWAVGRFQRLRPDLAGTATAATTPARRTCTGRWVRRPVPTLAQVTSTCVEVLPRRPEEEP